MKTKIDYDFEHFVSSFIDEISGEGKEFNSTFYRKIFDKAFRDSERNINLIISEIRGDIEKGLDQFKEEVSEKLAKEFSKYYWEKFQDSEDWFEGQKAICYYKEKDKYYIGTSIETQNGIEFLMDNGIIGSPDYVAPLYEFKGEK